MRIVRGLIIFVILGNRLDGCEEGRWFEMGVEGDVEVWRGTEREVDFCCVLGWGKWVYWGMRDGRY